MICIQFQREKKTFLRKYTSPLKITLGQKLLLGDRGRRAFVPCTEWLYSTHMRALKMYGSFLDLLRSKMNNLLIGTKILDQILIFPILWVRISYVIASFGHVYMNLCNSKPRIQWFLPWQISHGGLQGSTGHIILICVRILLVYWTDESVSTTLCQSWR